MKQPREEKREAQLRETVQWAHDQSVYRGERLDLKSRVYLFLLTPANLYCWFISSLFGVGWTGPYDDHNDDAGATS